MESESFPCSHFVFLKDTDEEALDTAAEILEGECTFKSNLEMMPFLCWFVLSLKGFGCDAALDADKQSRNTKTKSA